MAENLGKRPSKGILKTSSSFEKPDAPKRKQKETKWDEMNIIATLHPPDKDYGHMKIEEPKTPFNWVDEDAGADELDADLLAEKIRLGSKEPPKSIVEHSESEEESEEETEEAKAQRLAFESKRKHHYNEYYAVKLARKLMEQEKDIDEDSDDGSVGSDYDKDNGTKNKNVADGTLTTSDSHEKNCDNIRAASSDCS